MANSIYACFDRYISSEQSFFHWGVVQLGERKFHVRRGLRPTTLFRNIWGVEDNLIKSALHKDYINIANSRIGLLAFIIFSCFLCCLKQYKKSSKFQIKPFEQWVVSPNQCPRVLYFTSLSSLMFAWLNMASYYSHITVILFFYIKG